MADKQTKVAESVNAFASALQDWLQEIFDYAKLLGPRHKDLSRWWRRSSNEYVFALQRVVTCDDKAYGKAFHAKTWPAVVDAAYRSTLAELFRESVGTKTWRNRISLEDFAIRTLDDAIVVRPDGRFDIDSAAFLGRVNDLMSIAASPTLDSELVVFLDGVSGPDVSVDESRAIRNIADEELDQVVPLLILPASMKHGEPVVNVPPTRRLTLRFRTASEKVIGDVGPLTPIDIERYTEVEIPAALDAIAIVCGTRPLQLGWFYRPTNKLLQGGLSYAISSAGVPRSGDEFPQVKAIDNPELLARMWRGVLICNQQRIAGVRTAVRRLALATRRELSEDRLLDTLIAAEALFLSGEKEVSFQRQLTIAKRAVNWLKDQPITEVTEATLGVAFEYRNRILHGQSSESDFFPTLGGVYSAESLAVALNAIITAGTRKALDLIVDTRSFSPSWTALPEDELALSRQWYLTNRDRLREEFPNKYIGIVNGGVVDSAESFGELAKRLYSAFGKQPVFVASTIDDN